MDKTAEQIDRPAGEYVLVPVEPDTAQIEAGDDYLTEAGCNPMPGDAIWVYRAMIAARPADSDMVERVGKALCLSSGDDPEREGPWDTWWEESPYAAQARAAIAAISGEGL